MFSCGRNQKVFDRLTTNHIHPPFVFRLRSNCIYVPLALVHSCSCSTSLETVDVETGPTLQRIRLRWLLRRTRSVSLRSPAGYIRSEERRVGKECRFD